MSEHTKGQCKHPPSRYFTGVAMDARVSTGWVRWVACCDCCAVLASVPEVELDANRKPVPPTLDTLVARGILTTRRVNRVRA